MNGDESDMAGFGDDGAGGGTYKFMPPEQLSNSSAATTTKFDIYR